MEFLTVNETAAMLKVSPLTVRRHIAAGRLGVVRVGRAVRVRREAIERFIEPEPPMARQPEDPASRTWPLFTDDDPLWDLVGFISTGEPTDIAEHKDEYIADAIEASNR